MSMTHCICTHSVVGSGLSVALLSTAALWSAAFYECYLSGQFQNDLSAAPLMWGLTLLVAPATCFALALLLAATRHHSRLSLLSRCALGSAVLPVTIGTLAVVWAVKQVVFVAGVVN
jgi:hypothetical protein